ncbi:MAG: hypothetical protein CYPHOPRED_003981 [Cyphobasidiales sp. Tagirdzhanova-0007]|nr:MAG: hypothetical protein CYPHOPRED_003981 [Cyphobasidiales sp. Tagirdzhanova-0007]
MTFAKPADSLKGARILGKEELKDPKWVHLEGIKWETPNGTQVWVAVCKGEMAVLTDSSTVWECATRKTRGSAGVDAVAMLALISHPSSKSKPLSTVIVLQFRPPVNAICVELPAGLVDKDEKPEQAGERELYEETGYKGKTDEVSPVVVSDPGMTSANMQLTTIKVELEEGDELKEPEQHLDEGEFVEKRIVALKDLYQTLLDYNKLGYTVDARRALTKLIMMPYALLITDNLTG